MAFAMYITKKSSEILCNLLDFFVIYIANVHVLLYFFPNSWWPAGKGKRFLNEIASPTDECKFPAPFGQTLSGGGGGLVGQDPG